MIQTMADLMKSIYSTQPIFPDKMIGIFKPRFTRKQIRNIKRLNKIKGVHRDIYGYGKPCVIPLNFGK